MNWYGIEPLVPENPGRALELATIAEIPLVRQYIARRVVDAAGANGDLAPLVATLTAAKDAVLSDLLRGAREGLSGRKSLAMPAGWPAAYKRLKASADVQVRENAVVLALVFGDPQAITDLRAVATDPAAPPADRAAALSTLVEKRVPGLTPILHAQLTDPATRRAAVRGLAANPHPDTAAKVLAVYANLTADEKGDAVATLASRADSALALLAAVDGKAIPRGDVSAYAARQMHALGDSKVTERLKQVWGEVRETAADKKRLFAKFKAMLTPSAMQTADPGRGRAVYAKTCQQCHKLFGEGGAVGPDLTGGNRADVDYILSNVIDPSAEVGRDFRMSVVRTADGRVLTGIVTERTPNRLVLQTATEKLVIAADDVEGVKDSPTSIMPEGQLDALTRDQVRDLMAYLASKSQVPLPAGK
jgi:putative heme-binding domain-containing protein